MLELQAKVYYFICICSHEEVHTEHLNTRWCLFYRNTEDLKMIKGYASFSSVQEIIDDASLPGIKLFFNSKSDWKLDYIIYILVASSL